MDVRVVRELRGAREAIHVHRLPPLHDVPAGRIVSEDRVAVVVERRDALGEEVRHQVLLGESMDPEGAIWGRDASVLEDLGLIVQLLERLGRAVEAVVREHLLVVVEQVHRAEVWGAHHAAVRQHVAGARRREHVVEHVVGARQISDVAGPA